MRSAPSRPGSRHRRTAVAAAGLTLLLPLLTGLLVACSSGGDESSSPAGSADSSADSATDAPEVEPLATTAELGKVSGKLSKGKRSKVRKQVARAVDQWFEAAYVGGDYPRNDFSTAWPGFTTGAKLDAKADKRLMSNQDIGRKISSVKPTARRVFVDVLAVRGHPQGATARFVLKFKTDGDVKRKIQVSGRLFLTPSPDGWRIFGYDVTKGRFA